MKICYELLFVYFIFNVSSAARLSKFKTDGRSSDNSDDAFLDTLQLIRKYNYPSEVHDVVTEDGYKLKTFRIPRKGRPVLLVHGIGDTSDSWLVLGPKYSLAYQLADAGFDVWLYNVRGNRYSKEHIKQLTPKQYWDFSYDEMGLYDIPATVNYVLAETRQSKLSFVGFSQGTTAFLVMCSMRPEYNDKIDHSILLAPVAWMKHIKFPMIGFFAKNLHKLTWISETRQVYEVFPFNENKNMYHNSICNSLSPVRLLCELELYVYFGLNKFSNILPEKAPIITSHIPAGVSSKSFFHYVQGYNSEKFQRYDYGVVKNLQTYSSVTPPNYNLSLIRVPMTMFTSEVDWFSDANNVEILKSELKTEVKLVRINESVQFTHLEFVYGARVNSVINIPVLQILKDLNKT